MEKYIDFFKRDKFAGYCGIKLVECKPGHAIAQVDIEKHHLNGVNVVHGGLLFTLADFAFAAAVNAYGFVTLSVSSSISYFDKSETGIIMAEAKELSRSNKLINCDVSIKHESGLMLANFKGVAYITKKQITF